MARNVSSEEAQAAIEQASDLLNELARISSSAPIYEKNLRSALQASLDKKTYDVLSSITLDDLCTDQPKEKRFAQNADCNNAADIVDSKKLANRPIRKAALRCRNRAQQGLKLQLENESPYAESVLAAAHSLIKVRSYVQEASRLLESNRGGMQKCIEQLAPASGAMKWLFSSKEKKQVAELAFVELTANIEGDFGRGARRVIHRIDRLSQVPEKILWLDYEANSDAYDSVINASIPNCLGKDDWEFTSAQASERIDAIDGVLRGLEALQQSPKKAEQEIIVAANEYLSQELVNTLSKIPVEELARSKKGIRVKSLKSAGYDTVADVFSASVYNLESVKGISESAARGIKEAAKEFAVQTKKSLKIRISSDRRTPQTSSLVAEIYRQIALREIADRARCLLDTHHNAIGEAEDDLLIAQRRVDWLFASSAQKLQATAAFAKLGEYIDGDFRREANELARSHDAILGNKDIVNEAWQLFSSNPVVYSNTLEDIAPGLIGSDDALYGLPEDLAREVQDEAFFPDGLLCTLRRYQEWGVKYILHQEKVLLGDEMGLGKTVQAIATMVSLKNTGQTHFVVVCPASVLQSWCHEVRRHSKLRVVKIHGAGCKDAFEEWRRVGGVAVTTYETTGKLEVPEGFKYGLAVVDEAHYIKNESAARTKNTLVLCRATDRLLYMSGTALENRVDEMLVLIRQLRPDIAQKASSLAFMSGAQQFRDVIAPVYYRRKREDVLTELPDLIESEEWCSLGVEEELAYEKAVLSKNFMAARRVSWNVSSLGHSSKFKRLKEIIADAGGDGRKILIFTFFLDTARSIRDALGQNCVGVINGSVPPTKRQEMISSFDSAPAGSILIAQIQSGGTGLNIQCASVVVLCEPQYKPSIENQAISRAYRMGQTRNVLVYRLLCEDTVDERILELIKAKQTVFDAFADKSSAAAVSAEQDIQITDKGFGKIIEEEIERIKAKNPELAARVDAECTVAEEVASNDAAAAEPARTKRDTEERNVPVRIDVLCDVESDASEDESAKIEMPRGLESQVLSAATERGTIAGEVIKPACGNDLGVRFCIRCGSEFPDEAIFCPYCGAPRYEVH